MCGSFLRKLPRAPAKTGENAGPGSGKLNLCPGSETVFGNFRDKHSLVFGGERVDIGDAEFGTDGVDFVGNGVLGALLGFAVDFSEDFRSFRLAPSVAQVVVEFGDPVEVRLFFADVGSADLAGSFEQHVLEVMGEPGRIGRIAAAAGATTTQASMVGLLVEGLM